MASKSRDGEHTACTRHTSASAWGVTGPNSQRRKLNATWPEGVQIQKHLGYRAGGGAGRGQMCRACADQTVLPRCGLAGGEERSEEGGCALSGLGEGSFCRALGTLVQPLGSQSSGPREGQEGLAAWSEEASVPPGLKLFCGLLG